MKKEVKKAAKGAEEPEESNVNNWTDEEQELLNQGLAENPASMDKKERWKAIAAVVGTRNLKECAQRYKEVKENIIRKKQAEAKRTAAVHGAGSGNRWRSSAMRASPRSPRARAPPVRLSRSHRTKVHRSLRSREQRDHTNSDSYKARVSKWDVSCMGAFNTCSQQF